MSKSREFCYLPAYDVKGTSMNGKKALIGMSGGVDSSVAALRMVESGYNCIGATMHLYRNEILPPEGNNTCCALEDVEDARSVARKLGIPYYVFNFQDAFREQVIQHFVDAYESGLTPNPCIECNRKLKFDAFLDRALILGCDYVVTGHYARIRKDPDSGRYLLYKAADRAKDQTYFLACLNQHQLSHTQFPLGGLTKEQVRFIAQENGLVNARKHDSQDICFVPDGDYAAFLERFTGKHYPAGTFLNLDGEPIGQHRGAVCYTLGQRKGLGLAMGEPVYVCAKDMAANTVTVGPNEALYSSALRADNWNWIPFSALTAPMQVSVKIRHSQSEQSGTVYPEDDGKARVVFDQPQRAVTPGQAVVLYQGELVIGGGTITQAIR